MITASIRSARARDISQRPAALIWPNIVYYPMLGLCVLYCFSIHYTHHLIAVITFTYLRKSLRTLNQYPAHALPGHSLDVGYSLVSWKLLAASLHSLCYALTGAAVSSQMINEQISGKPLQAH